jgi:streptomycin 6-kinase
MEVPETVRNKVRRAGREDWLAGLPERVAELERDWAISVGEPYGRGTEAYVARALTHAGEPVVLKLIAPGVGEDPRHEITALRLAGGDGCARLRRFDLDRGALLLERLGRPMHELRLPILRRHEILCDLAAQIWRPAAGEGLPTGAEKAAWLADWIVTGWEETGRPCAERAVEHALGCARRRAAAHDDQRARLVHGDVHEWNALERGDGFALVDPDGLLAEPEYDLGIIMREDPVELLRGDPWERAHRLAARSGLDPVAIWEWGAVERLSTGLLATAVDKQPGGRQLLAAADKVAAWARSTRTSS